MSPTIVHCAEKENEACDINDIEAYQNVGIKPNVLTLLTYFHKNRFKYGMADLITTYHNRKLCIHTLFYYTRPPLYEEPYPEGCSYAVKTYKNVRDDEQDSPFYCDSIYVDQDGL